MKTHAKPGVRAAMGRSLRPTQKAGLLRSVLRPIRLALFVLALWALGLIWFAEEIPVDPAMTDIPTKQAATVSDAIIVLTGGSGRLDEGVRLLKLGYADRLFVSGVARGVEIAALMTLARETPEDVQCCIVLGYDADDTRGNAKETAAWVAANGYQRIMLVTANYHIERSLIEFRTMMPQVEIVPHPVFPRNVKVAQWWRWPGTARLVVLEYNKYLLSLAYSGWKHLSGHLSGLFSEALPA